MAINCKQCFNTHYQPHCHPTTKSLWLCSSVYCGPPHQSRRIWLATEAANQKPIGHLFYTIFSFVHHFESSVDFKLELQYRDAHSGKNLFVCLFVFILFSPTPYVSLISSYVCSIIPETAKVGSSYSHMRGPGIGCWFSNRSNCNHWSFKASVVPINPNIYTD